jgi:acetyl-CoA carboxylase carboxyltransferase component
MSTDDPRILGLRERRAQALEAAAPTASNASTPKASRRRANGWTTCSTPAPFRNWACSPRRAAGRRRTFAGDGVVTGFGLVDGRTVFAYAQDATIFGGALGEMHGRKICQVMDRAAEAGAPLIGLIDSGGARIQEGVYGLGGYAEIFRRNALYSGVVPQLSLLLGPCAGGAAYSPALTDLLIMVEQQSYMFLTGPEVIRAVTGEVVNAEQLGGARMHISTSGLAHFVAPSEEMPSPWRSAC